MTCIVALKDKNGVCWIGGDAAVVTNYGKSILSLPKIFQVGRLWIGSTGNLSVNSVLRFCLRYPDLKDGQSKEEFVHITFPAVIKETLKNSPISKEGFDDNILFVFDHEIYTLDCSDWSTLSVKSDFQAVGSGAHYALGALHATKEIQDGEKRVRLALSAAESFDSGVSHPFSIVQATA